MVKNKGKLLGPPLRDLKTSVVTKILFALIGQIKERLAREYVPGLIWSQTAAIQHL